MFIGGSDIYWISAKNEGSTAAANVPDRNTEMAGGGGRKWRCVLVIEYCY